MWTRIKRVFSDKTIVLRIAFTLFILLLLRVMSFIPVPLLDVEGISQLFNNSFFAILNSFSGQSLERFSILSLGITPYITGSIVVQLLVMVVPRLKEWSEEGENGQQKMNAVTRYIAVGIAFFQSLALILGAVSGPGNLFHIHYSGSNAMGYIYMALCMTAGTALAIWFADLITAKGIGNGSSMLITAGIVISIPPMFTTLWNKYVVNNTSNVQYLWLVIIILIYIFIILAIVFMELSVRKIPIQYANRQGKSDANVPIKVNTANVMPVIFASTIVSIPLTITGFLTSDQSTGVGYWMDQIFGFHNPIGFILYVVLIIAFTFFYAFLTVDPRKVADNLSKSNANIPGVRPGEETKTYISKVLFKTTVIGAVYLVILATLPIITAAIFGFKGLEAQAITIGGTSLLIVVGVAIETTKQLETDAQNEQYRGFLG